MGKFRLVETDMKIPCDTFQCHERTKYFLGREDSPKSLLINICEKCANELIEDIVNSVQFVNSISDVAITDAKIANIDASKITAGTINADEIIVPFEEPDDEYQTPEELNKSLQDYTVAELKELAGALGIEGISKKNKAELIKLLEVK